MADEIILVLQGTLRARMGEFEADVSADHTLVIPPHVPHGFTNEGVRIAFVRAPDDVRIELLERS